METALGTCHCTGCQEFSASAFSLTMAVPSGGFAVLQGELAIGGTHGPWAITGAPHSLATQPDLAGYEPLVAEFAKSGPRPS